MNSVLGSFQLGAWELGSVDVIAVTTGAFTGAANPSVALTPAGGIGLVFTAIAGTIQLGLFQLGQVPPGSVAAQETFGKGSFEGFAFPDIAMVQLRLSGDFTGAAYPDCWIGGNKGPLLVAFRAWPDAAAAAIAYYAEDSFSCSPFPDVYANGFRTGSAIGIAYPDVLLFPLAGEQIDCSVGPNPPAGLAPPNFVY